MTTSPTRWRRVVRYLWRSICGFLIVLGLLTLTRAVAFDITPIVSPSMAPTLQCSRAGNDWVLTDMLSGYFHSPQRWDVVDFTNADGVRVMKRVIALPGETIRIWKGVLYINGQPMARPDTFPPFDYLPYGNLQGGATQDCGAGYYVLGDDTADSQDSRFEGPIAPSRLRARALLIVWPYSRIGWVK